MNDCRELKETGQKYGVCGTLCHIVQTKPSSSSNFISASHHRYTMRVASVGEARAVLCRHSELINLSQTTHEVSTVASNPPDLHIHSISIKSINFSTLFFFFFQNLNHSQLGYSAMFPLVIPDPHVTEVELDETDECLIIANKRYKI